MAQRITVVQGEVLDSISREPLPYATVAIPATDVGTMTDLKGFFRMESAKPIPEIHVSMLGYARKTVKIKQGKTNSLTVELSPEGTVLQELVVRPKKEKYSKKNNPAVDLMERIRKDYPKRSPENKPFFSYEKYEKMVLALNDFGNQINAEGKWGFIKDYVITSSISGKPVLPLSVREISSLKMMRRHPGSKKEVINGKCHAGIEQIIDENSISKFVDDVFREVDIFQNDVTIMQNRFVSPLSGIAANYYKFYLGDTIPIDGHRYAELNFVPHNPESFGFTGRIYVSEADSTVFVKKVILQVPKAINLNYVDGIYIVQDFEQSPEGIRLKVRDDMMGEFSLIPGTQGLYASRQCTYSDFSFTPVKGGMEQFYDIAGEKFILADAEEKTDSYWEKKRNLLNKDKSSSSSVESMLARMRKIPLYYWGEKLLGILVNGYITTGSRSKFDIGPVNTFISANTIEGARFRLGGMTTANLNKHLFARGYVAYGCKDRKFKYSGLLEYSFIPKEYHNEEFPVNSIRLEHKYDIDQLGQHYLFTNADNIFLSLKRKPDNKITYRRLTTLAYKLERHSGFSFEVSLLHKIQEATGFLPFENGFGDIFKRYSIASAKVMFRYSPGQTFYQMRSDRLPINMDAPIFMLTHEYGPSGIFGNKFTLSKTEFSVQKRFWFSAFGYSDVIVKASKVWSRVPYPELPWPNANLSYTIQPESYLLMNAMEFAMDQQLSWDVTYWGNGILFNRIPLLKKLKLREVVSFRGVWGSLTEKNNPENNLNLYQFPFMSFAKPIGKTPYMEIGVGIDNILTILRVDYVWRLTYRDTPNTNKGGVRIALHFTF